MQTAKVAKLAKREKMKNGKTRGCHWLLTLNCKTYLRTFLRAHLRAFLWVTHLETVSLSWVYPSFSDATVSPIFLSLHLFFCCLKFFPWSSDRLFLSLSVFVSFPPFWAAAPKGTKSCRTQGTFVHSSVCSFVCPPRPSQAWNLPSQA